MPNYRILTTDEAIAMIIDGRHTDALDPDLPTAARIGIDAAVIQGIREGWLLAGYDDETGTVAFTGNPDVEPPEA